MPSEQISFRLPKELLMLVDELAARELRTRTNMLEFILMDWFREHEPDSFDDFGNIIDPSALKNARLEALREIKKTPKNRK
jgi:hypothetical protein